MDTVTRRFPIDLAVAPAADFSVDDDLRIARSRMRHLVPWNVEALPMMHSAAGTPNNEPLTQEDRKRCEHLALQVLAVQICQSGVTSALQYR
jgi:hypothetical protein